MAIVDSLKADPHIKIFANLKAKSYKQSKINKITKPTDNQNMVYWHWKETLASVVVYDIHTDTKIKINKNWTTITFWRSFSTIFMPWSLVSSSNR